MSDDYRRGPTDAETSEVAKQAGLRLSIILVAFSLAYYLPDGAPMAIVLLLIGVWALATAGRHTGEAVARLRLWWATRGYEK